jgi:hypothetical protein
MSNTFHLDRWPLRRLLSIAAVALAVVVTSLGSLIPGSPLGEPRPAGAQPVPAGTPGVIRYFGKGAYDGIRQAVASTPRSCDLSDDALTALVMAPIFKEVSMGETPETAPSPMTLSRWDEWSGRMGGSNNLHANYGLYAFRDPGTPYKRAFWTPGVGIFQYDAAGVGAPYTAAERIDVRYITADVAAGMAQRYCAAGGTAFNRRSAAWQPWQGLNGIAKSEALFHDMVGPGHPPFSTIGLVDGIHNGGGMQSRDCLSGGTKVRCFYVDPARAQGANWWATSNIDGGTVAAGEAPLTAPFYVVERDGYEERHWMAEDTGYDSDISARRRLGENDRPRDGEPQSGLAWYKASNICDPTRPEMGCTPPKPKPAPAPPPAPAKPAAAQQAKAPAEETPAEEKPADEKPADDRASLWAALVSAASAVRPDESGRDKREAPFTSKLSFARGLARVPPAPQ